MSNPGDFVIKNGVLTGYTGREGDVVIPDGVKEIAGRYYGVFSGWNCESVVIPPSVIKIGYRAFSACNYLNKVSLSEGLKYIGNDAFSGCNSLTEVSIPTSVKEIEYDAFANCRKLTNVILQEGLISIGAGAFSGCCTLKSLTIPDSVKKLSDGIVANCKELEWLSISEELMQTKRPDYFLNFREKQERYTSHVYSEGDDLNFLLQIRHSKDTMWLAFANRSRNCNLKGYGEKGFWERYDRELLNSGVNFRFKVPVRLIGAIERLKNPIELSASNKQLYTDYLRQNIKKLIPLLDQYHEVDAVKMLFDIGIIQEFNIKAVQKLIALAKDPAIVALSKEKPALLHETEKHAVSKVALVCERQMNSSGRTEQTTEETLKEFYTLTANYLPTLYDCEGLQVPRSVFPWLLIMHEQILSDRWNSMIVKPAYQKPGLCVEATEIIALLNPHSIQEAILKLGDDNLGRSGANKKHYLAYPLCRYADEATMLELTKRAPKWVSSVNGKNAPALATFREAAKYSNTRAAMLFAERYGELGEYAKLRGMTEDEMRDKYLSDVGLDEQGGKIYDLGNQTVTARLKKDLNFIFELPNGKTAKSLPKKESDMGKYEVAKADFDEMRKAVKKIVKSRSAVLFADFLSGKERASAEWQEAYLKNPLLRSVAELILWDQGGKTFIISNGKPVDFIGQPYVITDVPIKVAHPMEMEKKEIKTWQKYFTQLGLKQPFFQIWEPVIDPKMIREDRYEGSIQPMYRFSGKDKHGIHSGNLHAYSEDIGFSLDDCELDYEASTWRISYEGADGETYTLGKFSFEKYTRQVNHIVSLLDSWTVEDRIKKDDISVADRLDSFTLAQITEFIKTAQEAQAVNVLALLLEYKNAHFADFDPMEEFTLE